MCQFDSIFVGQIGLNFKKRVKVPQCKWVKIGTSSELIYRLDLTRKKPSVIPSLKIPSSNAKLFFIINVEQKYKSLKR